MGQAFFNRLNSDTGTTESLEPCTKRQGILTWEMTASGRINSNFVLSLYWIYLSNTYMIGKYGTLNCPKENLIIVSGSEKAPEVTKAETLSLFPAARMDAAPPIL